MPDLGHSAKNFFLKKINLCRVPNSRHSAKKDVAEHRYVGQPMPSAALLPRVWHSAKKSFAKCNYLPSARFLTLDKEFCTRQSLFFQQWDCLGIRIESTLVMSDIVKECEGRFVCTWLFIRGIVHHLE